MKFFAGIGMCWSRVYVIQSSWLRKGCQDIGNFKMLCTLVNIIIYEFFFIYIKGELIDEGISSDVLSGPALFMR